jgi:hypothetical protein
MTDSQTSLLGSFNDLRNTRSVNTTRGNSPRIDPMTKYILESLTVGEFISLAPNWTPETLPLTALIVHSATDAFWFDTLTEAHLVLFLLETHAPRLTRGGNFMPIPHSMANPQSFLNL